MSSIAVATAWQSPLAGLRTFARTTAYNEYYAGNGVAGFHLGVDLSAGSGNDDLGDVVRAPAAGVVMYVGTPHAEWGPSILIKHQLADGQVISSWIGHLQATQVKVGDAVAVGQPIGTIGNADGRYSAHIHWAMYRGELTVSSVIGYSPSPDPDLANGFIDPEAFLKEHASGGLTLYGTPGDDAGRLALFGDSGRDLIVGGSGNDTIDGRGDADVMFGGPGNDNYVVDSERDRVIETVSSTNLADAGGVDTVRASISLALPTFVENLVLTGSGSLSGTGNSLANRITGNSGNNVLRGEDGADTLDGGAGRDTLDGGRGNDILRGGRDADVLVGGDGNDVFVFAPGDSGQLQGWDRIMDYSKGIPGWGGGDRIDYSSSLKIGGSSATATPTQASIDQRTGLAKFAPGSGNTMADALQDIFSSFTAARDAAGEFAAFRVGGSGNVFVAISDGRPGLGANDVVVELIGVSGYRAVDLAGGQLSFLW